MPDKNKIASNLSAEQLEAFNERCRTTKGLTLQKIADMAAEAGIEISLMSAASYRDTTFEAYLEQIRERGRLADTITQVAQAGLNLSDAAAVGLNQQIFARSMDPDLADKDLDRLSLALARLRLGDQRAELLDARLKEYERREADWNDKRSQVKAKLEGVKAKGGLTKEALKQIEEAAAIL
jgi:hypothetical protein